MSKKKAKPKIERKTSKFTKWQVKQQINKKKTNPFPASLPSPARKAPLSPSHASPSLSRSLRRATIDGRPSVVAQSSRRTSSSSPPSRLPVPYCRHRSAVSPLSTLFCSIALFWSCVLPPSTSAGHRPLPAVIAADRCRCCRPATVHRPSRH